MVARRSLPAAVIRPILLPLFVILFSLYSLKALGANEADQAEERARNAFIDRFTKFTENKNVMGRPQSPDGKKAAGGRKTRFNQDDGEAFQSDLTYHDLAFNTVETEKGDNKGGNNKAAQVSRLFAFVSPHGGISAAGGSSVLERTAYQLHKQFTKQDDEEQNKKDDEKKGIKYRSIFKFETQEVVENDKGDGKAGKNDKKAEPDKVERATLREEARPQIEKVGEESFEEVRKAGRDQGYENDETTMANGVLLRYAAGAATQAMWNSSLANLVQRRVNRGIKAGQFPDTPQLSESLPTCAAWAQTAQGVLNKFNQGNKGGGDQQKALQEEIQRMTQQCNQLTAIPYNAINPRFEANEKNGKEELKIAGPQKEDGFIRDSRVQLEILNKAGKLASEVPSNWKYDAKDDKARITIGFDDNAKPQGEQEMTVKQQLESYNAQLQAAAEGYSEVQARLPDYKFDVNKTLSYQIQPNTKSIMQINQMPPEATDDVGVNMKAPNSAKNYNELLQQSSR